MIRQLLMAAAVYVVVRLVAGFLGLDPERWGEELRAAVNGRKRLEVTL